MTGSTKLVQPTADEAANGWNSSTLTAYLAERIEQKDRYANDPKLLRLRSLRIENATLYDPHHWRR